VTEPPLPEDEDARIETLRALRILDTAPEERFDRITRLAQRIFGVRIVLVSLVDSERQWFKSAQGLEEVRETSRSVSFCGHAILDDDVLHVPDARADERFHDNPLVTGEPNIRFYAGCPLRASNGRKLGTLCLIDSEPREFAADDRLLLKDLAAMVEHEIASLQLATLDELTLVCNRRGFNLLGGQALALCQRQGLGASLLVFDLNNFKPINDSFGHAEGDRALLAFANLLRESFRESDVIARIGGDEFAALLAGSDAQRVQGIAQRFRQVLDEYNDRKQRGYALRCSIGIATLQDGEDLDSLLERADRSMYAEKRASGRDSGEADAESGGTDDAWSI
jgi:diguanylate cyclase (GGDEF)-like protein